MSLWNCGKANRPWIRWIIWNKKEYLPRFSGIWDFLNRIPQMKYHKRGQHREGRSPLSCPLFDVYSSNPLPVTVSMHLQQHAVNA